MLLISDSSLFQSKSIFFIFLLKLKHFSELLFFFSMWVWHMGGGEATGGGLQGEMGVGWGVEFQRPQSLLSPQCLLAL